MIGIKLPIQPEGDKDTLVEFDVRELIKHLEDKRETSYEIVSKPDVEERNRPRPDYLVKESSSDKYIAIEHFKFFESQDKQRIYTERFKKEYEKTNGNIFRIYVIKNPNTKDVLVRLSRALGRKLSKRQFNDFNYAECIFLIRNKWTDVATADIAYISWKLKLRKLDKVDHLFMIHRQKLFEIY